MSVSAYEFQIIIFYKQIKNKIAFADNEVVKINGVEFTTYSFGRMKKCNDFIISFPCKGILRFGKILKIIKINNKKTFKVSVFESKQLYYNLFEYSESKYVTAYIDTDSEIMKCLNLSYGNKKYLSVLHFILIVD